MSKWLIIINIVSDQSFIQTTNFTIWIDLKVSKPVSNLIRIDLENILGKQNRIYHRKTKFEAKSTVQSKNPVCRRCITLFKTLIHHDLKSSRDHRTKKSNIPGRIRREASDLEPREKMIRRRQFMVRNRNHENPSLRCVFNYLYVWLYWAGAHDF